MSARRRIAIIGSRPAREITVASPEDVELFARALADVEAYVRALPADATVISGGADGVDRKAVEVARERRLNWIEYLPGREASPERYHARNQRIVDAADELVAFVTPWALGSWDSVRRARAKGIPIEIREWKRGCVRPGVTREVGR